jgi:hypothetical protein
MGDFTESKAKVQAVDRNTGTVKTDPWAVQQGYLKDVFSQAQDAYNASANNPYTGNLVAGYRPEQLGMFNNMINYANTSPIPSMFQSYGTNFSNMGQNATGSSIQGLQNFNPQDTQGNLANVGLYADNPYISSMVDAATRDARRSTYEGTIPQINQGAALSGNTNSSRTGAKEAVAERAYQDLRGDVSAQIRNNAWNQGLQATQNAQNMELARLGALGGQGLGSAGLGQSSLDNSVQAMSQLFGLGTAGGEGLRAADQAKLDNDYQKWALQQQQTWAPLQNYYNIVGADKWGGTATTKGFNTSNKNATNQPSDANVVGGILTGIGGLLPW